MRLTYDPRRNVAYTRCRAVADEVDTVRVSGDINIDFGPDVAAPASSS
jgi:uncharacterized protein YuzE